MKEQNKILTNEKILLKINFLTKNLIFNYYKLVMDVLQY